MSKACLCALGQTAPNPTLSTIRNFREEYLEHIRDHKCRSGKCKNLVVYEIDQEKCTGCGQCARRCPADCISGEKKKPHMIDQTKCLKCGECFKNCKFDAVKRA
jgi:NAD-dependent dihydropyrimidine dehydrogenase PreA subunit